MWQDPIVTETRQWRDAYADSLAHDPDAIFADILRRQAAHARRLVTYPPRPPLLPLPAAAGQPSVAVGA